MRGAVDRRPAETPDGVGARGPRPAPAVSARVAAAALLLAACAPAGPRVLVLPGSGRTFEQFTADDAACRDWASRQEGARSQSRYDVAYMQCMYARGHRVPVAGGGSGYTGATPATPAGVPPPPAGQPPPPPPGLAR